MKVGVITGSFRIDNLDECILKAKELGLEGVQIHAGEGPFAADTLTEEAKNHYVKLCKDNGLEISALCGDVGDFRHEDKNPERIARAKRIIDLAADIGTKYISAHIGMVPEDRNDPIYDIILKAVTEIGKYAKERGILYCIETGPERAVVLRRFLDETEGGVGVNLDPANFTMITKQDAVEAVYILSKYIGHTHLKDGRKLTDLHFTKVYSGWDEGGLAALQATQSFKELPVGEGDVDFENYIRALKAIGYDGFLTIEREAGDDRIGDVKRAAEYIREIIKRV